MKINKKIQWTFLLGAIFLLFFLQNIVNFLTDFWWFKEINYLQLFWLPVVYKLILFFVFGSVFFIFIYFNFYFLKKNKPQIYHINQNIIEISHLPWRNFLNNFFIIFLLLFSLIMAGSAQREWDIFLKFLNTVPFKILDPLFGKDLSFYIFKLPALKYIYSYLSFTLWLSLILVISVYFLEQGVYFFSRTIYFSPQAKIHIFILLSLFFILKSWGYKLAAYSLLHSSRGMVFGAAYTDVNILLPVLKILVILSLVCALLSLISIYIKEWKVLASGILILIGFSFFGGAIYPEIIQKFVVAPNEIEKERPYIERNIKYTKAAYGLSQVEEREFPVLEENLTSEDLKKNELTLKNIRLWDHRPLLDSYGQLQEIRSYYKFVDVDNDRYQINGEYRQTMLSPRELSLEKFPSKLWINEHLAYTHGYGVCLGPVNKVVEDGTPEFFIKDIPPLSTIKNLSINRPEIYYGEMTDFYSIVNTRLKEFDYPQGEENVYTHYQGKGGVPIDSMFKKIIFALKFSEPKILLSSDITRESRIMYYRQILERLKKITPFIAYDKDIYLVISQGKLYWIADGYTISDFYPYSQPAETGNYIRNSVKVIVDVYDGKVDFYISDPQDPIISAYRKIFPDLLKDFNLMPEDLKKHIRYPSGLFSIQAEVYTTYHMADPQVFYNKEDLWKIPHKTTEVQEREMQPYYTILKFPGALKEEFILMIPFTPAKKDNMISWMAARCDVPYYGRLMLYKFPKKKLIYGPSQIEARIDQEPEISKQLTLWGQGGSTVIRGSMLVIPIEKSLIYVEPLYLAAERGKIPELKRVIVVYKDKIAMQDNLEKSLQEIFGKPGLLEEKIIKERGEIKKSQGINLKELIKEANEHYQKAENYQRSGAWDMYGEELKKLRKVLENLQKITH
ncbi:MAG: UPF0182 family protein [Armatimonadetes bacterium]|nr:UPF0182 family protein [Armatimonadota bacterium]